MADVVFVEAEFFDFFKGFILENITLLKQKSGGDSIEGEILHQHNTGGTIVS